jgi:hypothetical protein
MRLLFICFITLLSLVPVADAQACCCEFASSPQAEKSYSAVMPVSANTTARTAFAGPTLLASNLVAGKSYRFTAWGTVGDDSASDVTLDIDLGGYVIASTTMYSDGVEQTPWHMDAVFTIQMEGAVSGMGMSYMSTVLGTVPSTDVDSPPLLDTTVDSVVSLGVTMTAPVWVNVRSWTVTPL